MGSLYTETIYLSEIKTHVRIYKDYGMAEIYFYSNHDRLMYQAKVNILNTVWYSVHVYRGKNDAESINKYPQYVEDVCCAVSRIIRAHNNNEITLW